MTKDQYLTLQLGLDHFDLLGDGAVEFLLKLEDKDPDESISPIAEGGLSMLANKLRRVLTDE